MSAIQRFSENMNEYPKIINHAKAVKGYTINTLVEDSGVSYSAVAKLLNGTQKNPSLWNAAALCDVLDLSLDEVTGLREPMSPDDEQQRRIHELELETEHLRQITDMQKQMLILRQTLIFGLVGVCALLLCAVIGYIIFDIQLKNVGLFQSTGVAATAVVLVVIVIAAICFVAYSLISVIRKRH